MTKFIENGIALMDQYWLELVNQTYLTFVETNLLFLLSSLSERLHYLKMNIFVLNNITFLSEDYHKYEIDFNGEAKTLTLLLVKN